MDSSMDRFALARIAFLWDFDFPCRRNFLPGFSLNTTPLWDQAPREYVLDKGCHHKRQYRFYTWNHFLDGWSKAICRTFHIGYDRIVYGQIRLFWLLFEGLFSVSPSLLANLSPLMLCESSFDKSCSSLEEKHFKKFCNTMRVFIS